MAEYQECDFSEKTDLLPPGPGAGAAFDTMDPKFPEQSPCDTCDYYATHECQKCGYFGAIVSSITG